MDCPTSGMNDRNSTNTVVLRYSCRRKYTPRSRRTFTQSICNARRVLPAAPLPAAVTLPIVPPTGVPRRRSPPSRLLRLLALRAPRTSVTRQNMTMTAAAARMGDSTVVRYLEV